MKGVCNIRARDLIEKFYPPEGSKIVKAAMKLDGRGITSEYICQKRRSLSWCFVWSKVNLVDIILNYLWFHWIDLPVLYLLNVHSEIIINGSIVFDV